MDCQENSCRGHDLVSSRVETVAGYPGCLVTRRTISISFIVEYIHIRIMVFNVTVNVEDNREGWGPCEIPDKLTSVPFLPYGKGERLGRIAEFGYSNMRNNRMGHYNSTFVVF